MRRYVIRRLAQLVPILLVITFLSFAMMRLAGSDAVLQKMENTGMALSPDAIERARAELGLDRPFVVQYVMWLANLLHGDMGVSYVTGKEVFSSFVSKLPATLLLAVDAIQMRDYPMIQAYVMWMAIIYVVANLLCDLSYRLLDPRIRLGGEES